MAISFRAKGESPGANSASCVIVKPVGLTEGDLMLAQVVGMSAAPQGAHTAPGGWVGIRQDGTTQPVSSLFWKIADAADVTASDFTFTATGATSNGGAISAWYDSDGAMAVDAHNGTFAGSTTTIISAPITPSVADCMILMFCAAANNFFISAYAIATDNPSTWTERYERNLDVTFDLSLAVGSATRPETTSTGNGTATVSSSVNVIGQLVALSPAVVAGGLQILGSRFLRGLKNFDR